MAQHSIRPWDASSWDEEKMAPRWRLAMSESVVTWWEDQTHLGRRKVRHIWGGRGPDLTGTRAGAWKEGGVSVV